MASLMAFTLMHEDIPVVRIKIQNDTGEIISLGKEENPEHLPVIALNDTAKLHEWWHDRAVPKTRKGLPAALQVLDVPANTCLLVQSLGLSLTDHYWIKPEGTDISWKGINLYEHFQSDVLGEFQFTHDSDTLIDLRGKTVFYPSASLQGELAKKWVLGEDGNIYLIKGNYGLSAGQSINEVFASDIHKLQGTREYTSYALTTVDLQSGTGLGCMCRNFASMDAEFISAYDIISSIPKPNNLSKYEHYINVCAEHGLPEEIHRPYLEYEIATDFLMTNTDRHFNNLGVLRDPHTLKFMKPAPIYDTGNSMFWNAMDVPQKLLFQVNVESFQTTEYRMMKYIQDFSVVDLSKLPAENSFKKLYEQDTLASEKRTDMLYDRFTDKVKLYEAVANGLDLQYAKQFLSSVGYEACLAIRRNDNKVGI